MSFARVLRRVGSTLFLLNDTFVVCALVDSFAGSFYSAFFFTFVAFKAMAFCSTSGKHSSESSSSDSSTFYVVLAF